MLLCTIPRHFASAGPSFVSVLPLPGRFVIGIVRDHVLLNVFAMAPGSVESLPGHLARVRRFLQRSEPAVEMPDELYYLGDTNVEEIDGMKVTHVSHPDMDRLQGNVRALRAVGVALSTGEGVPLFRGESAAARTRKARVPLYATAVAVVAAGLLALVVSTTARISFRRAVGRREAMYREAIVGNEDVRREMVQNRGLAGRIVSLERTLSRQTRWARFLRLLGEQRPEGLHFSKLGSEPVRGEENLVRIALVGWATSESPVTSLIAKLQETSMVIGAPVASLERGRERGAPTEFRIVCTLRLYDI